MSASWYLPFYRALKSGIVLFAHLIVALFIIGLIYALEHVLVWIGDPKIFDRIRWRYLFDFADLLIFVAFAFTGTIEAINVFRDHD